MLFDDFRRDPYPSRPKILFIGLSESTHTHSWIDLLNQSEFNLRLFALPSGMPPADWGIRTYVTQLTNRKLNPKTMVSLFSSRWIWRFMKHHAAKSIWGGTQELVDRWLVRIIRQWQPDIIHVLGLDPAGFFFFRVRQRFHLGGLGRWILQLRGGSDLTLNRLNPKISPHLGEVLRHCDQLLSDNEQNFRYALEMGMKKERITSLGAVPGTGGVPVSLLEESWRGNPSMRRLIVWPKAYDSPWSKALPVFEAIRMVWDQIQPCRIHMFAMTPETEMWFWALPEVIRNHCEIEERMPRDKVLEQMVRARVMLAPSLVDGTPNSMFEAMAAGAFPILSPLESITALVKNEQNVLLARNLYPEEIAHALFRAMTDDALVDRAAKRNLELVGKIADRAKIRPRVVEFYERLAKER